MTPIRTIAYVLAIVVSALTWSGQAKAQNDICPTAANGDNSVKCASTAFVRNALALPSAQIYVGDLTGHAVAVTMSGDCSIAVSGAITCAKTNGVAFAQEWQAAVKV